MCIHCDVPLVADGEQPAERPNPELPQIEEMVCIRAAPIGWVTALSEKLAEAGISHRIQGASDEDDEGSQTRPGYNMPFGVFVLPKDQEAAGQIDVEYMGSQIPDIPEDLDATGSETDNCPACGDPIPISEMECPGCGLMLMALDEPT
jgi:hypothetical protein